MKKRNDGRYQKQIVIGYSDQGYPIRKTVYGKTQREVNDKILELKGLMKDGIRIDNDMTFRDAFELYLSSKNRKNTTIKVYRSTLKNVEGLMPIPVKNLNKIMLAKELEDKKPFAQSQTMKIVKAIIHFLIDQDIIQKNPFRGINYHYDKKKRMPLTIEQQKIILNAPPSSQKTACLLMLLCGLRLGEALAITRRDIHDGKVYVTKQLNELGEISTPKSKSSVRAVPCPSLLYNEIKDKAILVMPSRCSTQNYLKRLCGATPHQLRHTYATNLFNSDVNVKTAQSYLGHSTLSMTMDIYTHLTEERSKEEMDKYEKYLKNLTTF